MHKLQPPGEQWQSNHRAGGDSNVQFAVSGGMVMFNLQSQGEQQYSSCSLRGNSNTQVAVSGGTRPTSDLSTVILKLHSQGKR
jgi:hypothetical protein